MLISGHTRDAYGVDEINRPVHESDWALYDDEPIHDALQLVHSAESG